MESIFMVLLKFSSTDGELMVPLPHIDYVLSQPGEGTSMLYLKTGRAFEVHGTLQDAVDKYQKSLVDTDWLKNVSGDAYGI